MVINKSYFLATLFFIVVKLNSNGQSQCVVDTIEGIFAFECSYSLINESDMVYRKYALVQVDQNSICYRKGIYLPDDPHVYLNSEICNVPEDIKIRIENAYNCDKCFTSPLYKLKSPSFCIKAKNKKKYVYKLVKLKFQVISIDVMETMIFDGDTLVKREVPMFLILDIIALSAPKKMKNFKPSNFW